MDNKELLIEASVQVAVKRIIVEMKLPIIEAMRQFYASAVFKKLQDYRTGLYLESPEHIYEMYQNELKSN